MKTFEQWWNSGNTMASEPKELAKEAWTAAQFALNEDLGIAANEAAKEERREVAVDELAELYESDGWNGKTVNEIIKQAQG